MKAMSVICLLFVVGCTTSAQGPLPLENKMPDLQPKLEARPCPAPNDTPECVKLFDVK